MKPEALDRRNEGTNIGVNPRCFGILEDGEVDMRKKGFNRKDRFYISLSTRSRVLSMQAFFAHSES